LKGNTLVSDQKVYIPENVNIPGAINLAEWSQPLYREGLSRDKNKSLGTVLERFERKVPKGVILDV
jgi:hypothetical protein